jgi:hypothetical protein
LVVLDIELEAVEDVFAERKIVGNSEGFYNAMTP